MMIRKLSIDRLGIWHDYELAGLDGGLTVFFGPNEAGKTTLVDFVRGMLFGFAAVRYRRYRDGQRPVGGRLTLDVSGRQLQIARHEDHPGSKAGESLELVDGAGEHLSAGLLEEWLGGVDEATFQHVFAVGLREMQELAALDATKAAELLYGIATGAQRISLAEVIRELDSSRRRLLADDERPSQIPHLLGQREKLRSEANQSASPARLAELIACRGRLGSEIAELEAQLEGLREAAARLALAHDLGDKWARRAALERQLSLAADLPRLPPDAVARLEHLNRLARRARRRTGAIKSRLGALCRQLEAVPIDDRWRRRLPWLAALVDQQSWAAALEEQSAELIRQIAALEQPSTSRDSDASAPQSESLPRLGPKTVARLKRLARTAAQARADWRKARPSGGAQPLERPGAADDDGVDELMTQELAEAGARVAQLRHRIELDERQSRLVRQKAELEEERQQLREGQVPPVWMLVALGGLFGGGVFLTLCGLFLPASLTGSAGWPMALIGLGATCLAVIIKHVVDREAAKQLETCQRQLKVVVEELADARARRDELDAELPRGGGPLTARLQAAQRTLEQLESEVAARTRKQAERTEARAADERLEELRALHRRARHRWQQALARHGLPADLHPSRLERLIRRRGSRRPLGELADLKRRLAASQQSLAALRQRLDDALPPGAAPATGGLAARLAELRFELIQQREREEERAELESRARAARRALRSAHRRLRRARRIRRALLRRAGAADSREFRRRVLEIARLDQLRQERAALSDELDQALAAQGHPREIEQLLSLEPTDALQRRWEEAALAAESCADRLKALYQQQGATAQQLAELAEDRRPARKQLELAAVEERLRSAVGQWQVLTAASAALSAVRQRYERDRQPTTLRLASRYLERMTAGRYVRIWTPLDEEVLRVDDGQGQTHPVERLSDGTREQVFLALRLALVEWYSAAAPLPLVLDDVLVNFDAKRARACALALREFAAGRQVILLTCHEHMARMFRSLKVPVRELLPSEPALPIEPPLELEPIQPAAEAVKNAAAPAVEPSRGGDDDIPWDIPLTLDRPKAATRRRPQSPGPPAPHFRPVARHEPYDWEDLAETWQRLESLWPIWGHERAPSPPPRPASPRPRAEIAHDETAEEFIGEFNERLVDLPRLPGRDAAAA